MSEPLLGRTIQLCFWRVSSAAMPQTEWLDAQWERTDAWTSAHASRTRARHVGFEDEAHRALAAASRRDE